MRRAALAVIGTVAGTALMVGAKLGTPRPDDPAAATAADDPAASAAPPAAAPAGSSPPPASAGPAAPGRSPTGKPAPPPPPAGGGLKNGTFTGGGAAARHYEVVTVTITVSGGRITVANGSCGNASGESRAICGDAMPKLQQETLARQSANIATVSGATYTSDAYMSSLQSALDRAKA
jgi:uncharacterized protein with FMN-binding domain